MGCIPFCFSCGRPIDCTDHGMCLICREKLIEQYRNKEVTKLSSNTSLKDDKPVDFDGDKLCSRNLFHEQS